MHLFEVLGQHKMLFLTFLPYAGQLLNKGKLPKTVPPDVSEAEAPPPPSLPVKRQPEQRPIIIGMGPTGLFCALELAQRGVRSILLDRGRDVIQRRKDVAKLMRDGTLMTESNMSFGEGGAGAYTDGKLSTRINHPSVRKVIETFAKYGAPERILVQGKPHIGSDLLPLSVERMRKDLIELGVEVRFETRVEDLLSRDGVVTGVKLHDGTELHSDRVILAPGNSARELFELSNWTRIAESIVSARLSMWVRYFSGACPASINAARAWAASLTGNVRFGPAKSLEGSACRSAAVRRAIRNLL
jgi:uncharacterized FAD-dependent dehydrogenase